MLGTWGPISGSAHRWLTCPAAWSEVRGDLVSALAEIQRKIAAGSHLDMILVETTGMADPVDYESNASARSKLNWKLKKTDFEN